MKPHLSYAPSPVRTGGFGFTLGCFLTATPVGVIGAFFHLHYWDNDAHMGFMEYGLLEFGLSVVSIVLGIIAISRDRCRRLAAWTLGLSIVVIVVACCAPFPRNVVLL